MISFEIFLIVGVPCLIIFGLLLFWIISSIVRFSNRKRIMSNIRGLAGERPIIEATDFLKSYLDLKKQDNREGVYILFNEDKKMYYVGQSIYVIDRIKQHLWGQGCIELFDDFSRGNKIYVKIIYLDETDYRSLNQLEKDAIMTYKSYYKGYNKTRGVGFRYDKSQKKKKKRRF